VQHARQGALHSRFLSHPGKIVGTLLAFCGSCAETTSPKRAQTRFGALQPVPHARQGAVRSRFLPHLGQTVWTVLTPWLPPAITQWVRRFSSIRRNEVRSLVEQQCSTGEPRRLSTISSALWRQPPTDVRNIAFPSAGDSSIPSTHLYPRSASRRAVGH
jgi:hypothetical protein